MNEKKWLACREPSSLIQRIEARPRKEQYRLFWRKLVLFAINCCRHIDHLLVDQRCRNALAICERSLEGDASAKEGDRAFDDVTAAEAEGWEGMTAGQLQALSAVTITVWFTFNWDQNQDIVADVRGVAEETARAVTNAARPRGDDESYMRANPTESSFQAELFREIFGNPFRSVSFDPSWRTSDVLLLAQGIYAERAFDRMPILADALQDAGCDSADILGHLRDSQAIHVRGCWALDLVLGKE
jgi:hypothetical protein